MPPRPAPARRESPDETVRQAPARPPIRMRPTSEPALVRLGVRGSLSATYSATAKGLNRTTAAVLSMNETREPSRLSHPRHAAQLTAAGAVIDLRPATMPMAAARPRV